MEIKELAYQGKPMPFPIIDAHTHIGPKYKRGWNEMEEYGCLEGRMKVYDSMGINCCVTTDHTMGEDIAERTNELAAEAIARYPGRIYAYIFITAWKDMDVCKKLLNTYSKHPGFVGVKFLTNYQGLLDEPVYQYAADFCNEVSCPLLVHTWADSPSVDSIAQMAETRPNLKMVAAHQAGGSERMTRKYAEKAKNIPNLYMDICGSARNSLSIGDMVELMGEDRIFFASDMSDVDARYEFGKVAFSSVSDDVKKKIFAGNYLKVLETSQLGKIIF